MTKFFKQNLHRALNSNLICNTFFKKTRYTIIIHLMTLFLSIPLENIRKPWMNETSRLKLVKSMRKVRKQRNLDFVTPLLFNSFIKKQPALKHRAKISKKTLTLAFSGQTLAPELKRASSFIQSYER